MRSGFFNSNIIGYDDEGMPIYDRAEEASFFAQYFANFIGNGIYPNPSNGMQVVFDTDRTVKVSEGYCFIKGYLGIAENDEVVLEEPDTTYARIDRIVARLNIEDREITIKVKKGTPSADPVPTDIERNSNIYELALADIRINKGATSISQANITDMRLDNSVCGIVTGVIDQVDTTTLFNQYLTWFEEMKKQSSSDYKTWFEDFTVPSEEEFNDWFERIKGQLSEDAAGNLQLQINNIITYKYTLSITETTEAVAEITLPCYYKVGQDVLDVYLEDERLIKSSDEAGTDGHYVEVGEADSISNKIKITSDWAVEAGMTFEFVIRGEYSV